jgi:hypothetical protein
MGASKNANIRGYIAPPQISFLSSRSLAGQLSRYLLCVRNWVSNELEPELYNDEKKGRLTKKATHSLLRVLLCFS